MSSKKKKNYLKDIKMKESKKELKELITSLRKSNSHLRNSAITKRGQIRSMRLRLKKIRNSIDYLLKFPYSADVGIQTRPHKRDRIGTKKVKK